MSFLPEALLITINGLFTLAILSFLFRDNPIYKFAEHLFIGVAAGYYVAIEWHNVFLPNLWRPLIGGGEDGPRLVLLIPFIISLLMFSRFVPRYAWLSRWSLALMVGAYAGLAVIGAAQGDLIRQVEATMVPVVPREGAPWFDSADPSGPTALNNLILAIGLFASLAYFFFSREHRGGLGRVAKLGIWFLMLSFGASYGFTVMARYSLMIGRLDLLLRDWPAAAPGVAQVCLVLFVLGLAVATILEIRARRAGRGTAGH
jgi:hypothetical protein